jgi:hypothetical protein
MDELFDPQSSPVNTVVYSSLAASSVLAFFFEAFLAAGFSVAVASDFGVARFARGAAAAPPRFRRFALRELRRLRFYCFGCLPFLAGRSSLLKRIVT